jgi:AcrR family transcriptional regulator
MSQPAPKRRERHGATRSAILEAARCVVLRDSAKDFSLRRVAAEADFAPAALYSYFANKNELLLALAVEDLSDLTLTIRNAGGKFSAVATAVVDHLQKAEAIVATSGALPDQTSSSEAGRLFNGRLIAVLKALAEMRGAALESRDAQIDVILLAAVLTGLAMFVRSGRLDVLGFSLEELIGGLDRRFAR